MVLRVEVPPSDAEVAADLLWQAGATAVGEEDVSDDAGDRVRLTADLDVVPPSVADRGWVVVAWTDDGAWQDGWRPHARAVAAGPFWVRPPWVEAPPPSPDLHELLLDGGRAFGTGSHPSTVSALLLVADLARPGLSVLDVGCGSGALAIGAALLGASPVVALDPDPEAVAATVANAAANGVDVEVVATDLEGASLGGRSVDVVVANVGAPLVDDLASPLRAALAPEGALVLAGMLVGREAQAAASYPDLAVTSVADVDGWTAIVLASSASGPATTTPAAGEQRASAPAPAGA